MSTVRIMIVEDEVIVARGLRESLRGLGYEVCACVTSGEQALEVAAVERPDLALMDISLAGAMDGIETAGRLRELSNTPVVFVTAYADEEKLDRAKVVAPSGYLLKPVDDTELRITMEMAVHAAELDARRRRAEEELAALNFELEARVSKRTASLEAEVAERLQAERELRLSETRLRAVFDGVTDVQFFYDAPRGICLLNRAAMDYYQAEDALRVNHHCLEAFSSAGHGPCELCRIRQAIESGDLTEFERPGWRDATRVERVRIFPFADGSDKERSAVVRIMDVTETRDLEQRLRLGEKLAALGLLVAGIAHEMNNPNNFIAFNLPTLKEFVQALLPLGEREAEADHHYTVLGLPWSEFRDDMLGLIDSIAVGSKRITSIVSDLRKFAQQPGASAEQTIDLHATIEHCLALARERLEQSVKTFELVYSAQLPARIHASETVIEHVLSNLLGNAAQAMDKDDSRVTLTVAPGGERGELLHLEVNDNGCGMAADERDHVFDPFFTTKSPGDGAGLGLSISYHLMESHGGRIEVESEPGQGSTFRAIFALRPAGDEDLADGDERPA